MQEISNGAVTASYLRSLRIDEPLVRVGVNGFIAEPVSFRNDYLGLDQEVYRYDETGKPTHIDTKLKVQLREFAQIWFVNLKEQGFLGGQAVRNILSP